MILSLIHISWVERRALQHLQPDGLPHMAAGFFFRASILSRHIFFLHPDASILHLSGGLHNYWDGLRAVSYTHLDVYKGQALCTAFFSASLMPYPSDVNCQN